MKRTANISIEIEGVYLDGSVSFDQDDLEVLALEIVGVDCNWMLTNRIILNAITVQVKESLLDE